MIMGIVVKLSEAKGKGSVWGGEPWISITS